ncbi:MAG: hypothetical protein Q9218_005294 [Villophora microphyllina]
MLPPILSFISCIFILIDKASLSWALWPVPASYQHGVEVVWIANDVAFRYSIANETAASPDVSNATTASVTLNSASSYAIVEAAIQRTQDRLFNDNFVPWKFHPRNSVFEPNHTATRTFITSVTLQQNRTDSASILKPLAGEVNESYNLSITTSGAVLITAISSIGILRALDTFTQLFYKHSVQSAGIYCPYAPVSIVDAPKFAHRGLNMDVARNYYAPSDILHAIDALAWNKFNRLHLHVTDAQSWPLDIPTLPNLSKKGAYKTGLSYSRRDLDQIQEYGMYRGVEVIIEIDMPGHTSSIHWAYPDFIAGYNIQPDWNNYAAEPPSGSLKLNSSAVYDFLHSLWEDLLPRVASYSAYFHTGGDELNANIYKFDDTVKSIDSAVIQPLLQRFVDFNHGYVRAAGMTPMVWEEMLVEWNITLGQDVVVQTWRSDEALVETVMKGHKALAGNYNYWYLDCGYGTSLDPPLPAASSNTTTNPYYPYLDYCTPLKNWRLVYSYNPLAGIPANLTHLVLGGEVHIWSELVDPVNFDSVVWPRAAAAAEVLWSGAKGEDERNRSLVDAAGRLGEWRERMVARGVRAGVVQMVFCEMGGHSKNGSQCMDMG